MILPSRLVRLPARRERREGTGELAPMVREWLG